MAVSRFALVLALSLTTASGCKKGDKSAAAGDKEPPSSESLHGERLRKSGHVRLAVTVDWEGQYLFDESLALMQSVRADLPTLVFTHFVSPAYFTHGGGEDETAAKKISDALREGDELALHFHGWHSLVKAAGVEPRSTPTYYAEEAEDSQLFVSELGDRGYEVPITAYEPEEIAKLLAASKKYFADAKLPLGKSFRSGGCAMNPEVQRELVAAGFAVDSSACWAPWYEEGRGRFQESVRSMWPSIEEMTQPYAVEIDAGSKQLIVVPNSGAFVEYAKPSEMRAHLDHARALSIKRQMPVVVNVGFHQETADEYLEDLVDMLRDYQYEFPDSLEFITVAQAAQAAR